MQPYMDKVTLHSASLPKYAFLLTYIRSLHFVPLGTLVLLASHYRAESCYSGAVYAFVIENVYRHGMRLSYALMAMLLLLEDDTGLDIWEVFRGRLHRMCVNILFPFLSS